MNQAEEYIDQYFARLKLVGRTRFDPRHARKERDEKLPGVTFYRFPDGSIARREADGDITA